MIVEKAIEEIQNKTYGSTEQILNVHEVVYVNNKPEVLRVDTEGNDGTVVVYFPIKDERFYLAIYLETEPDIAVKSVGTENYNSVYLRATSGDMNFEQLSKLTRLDSTRGWSKGDQRRSNSTFYNFSAICFEPNPEPDTFEDKLRKLLDFLEEDKDGILKLAHKANGYIQVVTAFYNGNTMLGGHHLDKDIIKRLSSLNLEIDFDLYAEGNFFQD
jgi:hypothetical protein